MMEQLEQIRVAIVGVEAAVYLLAGIAGLGLGTIVVLLAAFLFVKKT